MSRRQYDHQIRNAVVESGDITLFAHLNIPDSTLRSWLRRGAWSVVTTRDERRDATALRVKVAKLERRVATLGAVVRLLMILLRTTGVSLAKVRVSSAAGMSKILRGFERAAPIIGRQAALRVLGLRPARLREWKNAERVCELGDSPPCPRSVPTRLTLDERHAIREMVESDVYKHLSIRSLSLLAQRMGRVFAAYGTWCRLIRAHGWRRPRRCLYPAKPKIGVRAQRPGEWLHIHTTVIKLLDGTKAYLHAVVDNYTRRVLAWALKTKLTAETTRTIRREAADSFRIPAGPSV